MKKSVLALAVLGAFASVASAQSSVTLYGRLDTAVTWTDPGSDGSVTGGGTGDDVWRLNGHDPIGGSRFGFRGVEDLGGGLKANFVIESGFNSDTGSSANATRLFDRQAFVGLSSMSLGEVRLGRQQTLTRETHLLAADITGEGELSVVAAPTGRVLFQNFGTRVDNAAQYLSPNFGGFQVRGMVAAGEGVAPRQQGVMLGFSSGPIKAGLTYEMLDGGPGNDSGTFNKVATLGASYDFGFATLSGAYQNSRDLLVGTDEVDHDAWAIGAMVPFGAFQFRAQYITSTVELPGGDVDTDKYGASLRYSLSKRTQLYAVALKFSGDDDESFNRETQVVFGIGHNF